MAMLCLLFLIISIFASHHMIQGYSQPQNMYTIGKIHLPIYWRRLFPSLQERGSQELASDATSHKGQYSNRSVSRGSLPPFYIANPFQALYCTNVDAAVLRSAKMVVLKPGQCRQPRRTGQNGLLMSAILLGRPLPFRARTYKDSTEKVNNGGKVKHGFLYIYLKHLY